MSIDRRHVQEVLSRSLRIVLVHRPSSACLASVFSEPTGRDAAAVRRATAMRATQRPYREVRLNACLRRMHIT